MLSKIADFYDDEVDTAVTALTVAARADHDRLPRRGHRRPRRRHVPADLPAGHAGQVARERWWPSRQALRTSAAGPEPGAARRGRHRAGGRAAAPVRRRPSRRLRALRPGACSAAAAGLPACCSLAGPRATASARFAWFHLAARRRCSSRRIVAATGGPRRSSSSSTCSRVIAACFVLSRTRRARHRGALQPALPRRSCWAGPSCRCLSSASPTETTALEILTVFLNAGVLLVVAIVPGSLAERYHQLQQHLEAQRKHLSDLQAFRDLIFQSVGSGLVAVDPQGRVTAFNRAAESITGVSRHEALGQPLGDDLRRRGGPGGGADRGGRRRRATPRATSSALRRRDGQRGARAASPSGRSAPARARSWASSASARTSRPSSRWSRGCGRPTAWRRSGACPRTSPTRSATRSPPSSGAIEALARELPPDAAREPPGRDRAARVRAAQPHHRRLPRVRAAGAAVAARRQHGRDPGRGAAADRAPRPARQPQGGPRVRRDAADARRSPAVPAGHLEPLPQRRPGHARRRRAAGGRRAAPGRGGGRLQIWICDTRPRHRRRRTCRTSSSRSSPPSPRAAASAWPSSTASSRSTAANRGAQPRRRGHDVHPDPARLRRHEPG